MKIKLAFGFLPYLEFVKNMGGNSGGSKYFVTFRDPKAHTEVDEHEEVHVAFWYIGSFLATFGIWLLGGVPLELAAMIGIHVEPLVGTFVKSYTRWEETFAYSRAASLKEDPTWYLNQIATNPVIIEKYGEDFIDDVRKRMSFWK